MAASRSKLRLLLASGAVLAGLGGSARLVQQEVGRVDRQAEIAALRSQAAFRTREAEHAGTLEVKTAELRLERERLAGELTQARDALTRLEGQSADLQQRLSTAESAAQDALEHQAAESQTRLAEVERLRTQAAELAAQRAEALERLERALKETRASLAEREAALATQQDRARSLAQALDASQDALAQAQERERNERARAAEAERLLERLRGAGVNVDRLTGLDPMPDIRAKVVKVDETATPPQLVVDAGAEQGLQLRDALFLVREGREVARLEVEEVRERICAARVVRLRKGLRIRPGDAVVSLPPER